MIGKLQRQGRGGRERRGREEEGEEMQQLAMAKAAYGDAFPMV